MSKLMNKLTQPVKDFWLSEFVIAKKRFYYGSVISAILILAFVVFLIAYFGIIGFLVFWAKQGVRMLVVMLAQVTAKTLLVLGVKRAVIDFVVSPILRRHVFSHLIPAIIARLKESKYLLGKWLARILGGTLVIILAVFAFFTKGWLLLKTIAGFLLGKFAAIFGFKSVWAIVAAFWGFLAKAWIYIKTTPIGVLIQVYILSVIMDILAKLIPERMKRRLVPVRDAIVKCFWKFQHFLGELFGWHLEERVKKIARFIEPHYERKKRISERLKLALEQKKQKQKEKKHPSARITRFRKEDKNCPRYNDQWRR